MPVLESARLVDAYLSEYDRAVREGFSVPQQADFLFRRGRSLYHDGDLDGALEDVREAGGLLLDARCS